MGHFHDARIARLQRAGGDEPRIGQNAQDSIDGDRVARCE